MRGEWLRRKTFQILMELLDGWNVSDTNLSLRVKTKSSQELPRDLKEKITKSFSYIIKIRKKYDYPLVNIGNMDETPVWLDMPSARTVNTVGEKTVLVKTTGHEKNRFKVVLSCLADGTKLKPMIIFKRKTVPNFPFPAGVIIHAQKNGWMDEAGMKIWIGKVWRGRPGGLLRKKSLLVYGSFSAHLVDSVKTSLRSAHHSNIAVIPGCLTSVQPIDVRLNNPFKELSS